MKNLFILLFLSFNLTYANNLFDLRQHDFIVGYYFDVEQGETKDSKYVKIPFPGFDKKDISLVYYKGYIIVEGKKGKEKSILKENKMYNLYIGNHKPNKIKSTYKNGLVTVFYPKKEDNNISYKIKIK